MSAPRVVVVGAGVAGVAAAFEASRGGAQVTLLRGGVGASALGAGAADETPWDELERAASVTGAELDAHPLAAEVRAFAEALDLWTVADDGAPMPRLATTAGVVRSARAHDRALLDLHTCRGRKLLLPRAERAGWDADSLVRCLQAGLSPADEIELEAVGAPVLRFDEERDIVDVDLAARHDDDARLRWLASSLRAEVERHGQDAVAVLLGPWLGAARPRAHALGELLGVPVGEALAATAGSAGCRFERARDALLERLGVQCTAGWVERVEQVGASRPRLVLRGGEPLTCDLVVLATGGLIGGGVRYAPPEHGAPAEGPRKVRASLALSPAVEGARLSFGGDHGPASSTLGPVLDQTAWPRGPEDGALERAGVLVDHRARVAPGVLAAGDVVFGARRTLLTAVASGLAAGRAAIELSRPDAPSERAP